MSNEGTSHFEVEIDLRRRDLRHGDFEDREASRKNFRDIRVTLSAGAPPKKLGVADLAFNPRFNSGDTVPIEASRLYNALRTHVGRFSPDERADMLKEGLNTLAGAMDNVADHLEARDEPGRGVIDSDKMRAHQVREIAGSFRDLAEGKNPKTGEPLEIAKQMLHYGEIPMERAQISR